MMVLDARKFRPLEGGPSFCIWNRAFRLLWQIAWLVLAAWTPPPMRAWRRRVLMLFGADLAPKADVRASARIWFPPHLRMGPCAVIGPGVICYNMAPVTIGARVVVSQRAHLCTGSHDLADPDFQLIAKPITFDDHVWIAAEAFVGPGVHAGEGAVLAARGAAFRNLEAWSVHQGNPAQPIRRRAFREQTSCGNGDGTKVQKLML